MKLLPLKLLLPKLRPLKPLRLKPRLPKKLLRLLTPLPRPLKLRLPSNQSASAADVKRGMPSASPFFIAPITFLPRVLP